MNHLVLAVDDEPASLRTIQRALAPLCPVRTVEGARAGLDVLAAEAVTLIVADHRMPEMTGTEFLALAAASYPETIRVLLTGYTDVETVIGAINAGQVYYYLTKPWEVADLQLVVRRGLERHDAEAERRRMVRELEEAYARVQREAERKGRLLTMAAHELGTPLHVLLNALDLLACGGVSDTAVRWLETAQRNAAWLGRGLAHMTTAARALAGALTVRRGPLRFTSVCAEVIEEVALRAGGRYLTYDVDVPDDLPLIDADARWLRCALTNVLANAVRFTPDGGRVMVRAWAESPTERLVITVQDTGVGIDPAHLADVFEPFSAAGGDPFLHASGSLQFGARGLGLGLALTRAIVALHDGTVAAESRPQRGSCFTITLPRRAAGVVGCARDDVHGQAGGGGAG